MKKIKRNLFTIFTVMFVCLVVFMLPGNVQAASKKTKAKKAYASYLRKEAKNTSGTLKFGLIDINKDGVPEMVTASDDMYHASILAYVNGKVKKIGWAFSGECAFYPSRKVYYSHTCHSGVDEYHYYKFNGKKMTEVACKYGNDTYNAITGELKTEWQRLSFEPYKYTVKGKVVTAEKYNKYVKSLAGRVKKKMPTMRKNTAKNRKKYLSK